MNASERTAKLAQLGVCNPRVTRLGDSAAIHSISILRHEVVQESFTETCYPLIRDHDIISLIIFVHRDRIFPLFRSLTPREAEKNR